MIKSKAASAPNLQLADRISKSTITKNQHHLLWITYGEVILLICSSSVNSIKKYVFYYMLLAFVVYMHGLFLCKIKNKTITKTFQKIMKDSNFKPNKIWVDKTSEFFNSSIKLWLRSSIKK